MVKLTLQDLPLAGKKILIRVDYNVPLSKDGSITDDTRIRASIPTIQKALQDGAAVILISHLGRPKSKQDIQFSLGICAKRLSQLIAAPVLFATDCIGKEVDKMIQEIKGGQVLLLENLRYYPAEENPALDPNFAKELAKGIDYYVNDAFAAAHRAHSSTAIIEQYFPGRAAMGLLMEKEIHFLQPLLEDPKRPFYVVIGGAKVSSKIGGLKSLLQHVDAFFIGGGMGLTFLKAQGLEMGASTIETALLNEARVFMQAAHEKKIPLYLPLDLVIADQFRNDATYKTLTLPEPIPAGWIGMDIGPITIQAWSECFKKASTVFWNGPLGVCEFPHFARGTEAIARCLVNLDATTIIGGGDSVAAIQALGLAGKCTHLSTGGGASLEFLEKGHLPGIDALSDKSQKNT
ncbi:MAG: phosphoglycerate kinase [Rhabdochlamydiaceae bacterium]